MFYNLIQQYFIRKTYTYTCTTNFYEYYYEDVYNDYYLIFMRFFKKALSQIHSFLICDGRIMSATILMYSEVFFVARLSALKIKCNCHASGVSPPRTNEQGKVGYFKVVNVNDQ